MPFYVGNNKDLIEPKKISDLESTSSLNNEDIIIIESEGVEKNISIENLTLAIAGRIGISLDGAVPKFTGQVNDSGTVNPVWGAVVNT